MRWEEQSARRRLATAALVLAWYAALVVAFLGWIGWFGGRLFTWVEPTAGRPRAVAIFFSGDMGFKVGMGPRLASRLARRRIAVLGLNSLVFFGRERTQAEAERLVEAAMIEAAGRAPRAPLVLVGQSFGADALQLGLATLPEAARRRIGLIALIVPDERIQLRLSPGDAWTVAARTYDGAAIGRRLTWAPLLCIQGREQTDSLCPALRLGNMTRVVLPGGHQLRRDADRLAGLLGDAILAAARPGQFHRAVTSPPYPGISS
jgi:type IV secretory pathway VirJ component